MLSSDDDDVQWEDFGKKILQDNVKIEDMDHFQKPCHQTKWNVINEDSNTLILTVELGSKESICSLSSADLRVAYPHICQYVLDRCLNNIKCGKHGHCVNNQTDFNCSCSFLYDGLFCEKCIVEPIKLLRITDRYSTTWIIVIQMLEILGVLEETIIDIDESAQYGVFAQILKRVFFVILIALRYYPTLASLQFQNFFTTTGESNDSGNANLNQQGCWNRFREYASSIYEWDKHFRFTTVAISTYIVAFIFLFHLTGTVILLYKTPTNSLIRCTKHLFEVILNIEVKEWSFQGEVIISAIITMIIYGIQLFLTIKNYRKCMGDLYNKYLEEPELCKKLKKREIIRKSTQYPSYLLLYLLGGAIGYIIPILVLYGLQKMIIQWIHKIFDYFDKREESDLNLKLNIFDSILLYLKLISGCFIGIIASIIRLSFSVLVNIIFMPRFDYCYLVEPLETLDSAHESFRAFLRLEILCTYPLINDFSPSVRLAPHGGTLVNRETPAVTQQDESRDAENNGNSNDRTTPTEQQSLLSQDSSLHRVYEPVSTNMTSADDEDLALALVGHEQ
ncbi:unnamed protein product [Rotaria sp. Silwood1]|nr:unnamed protein product [Rotaria sp. Silwood1]CAF1595503.1 unnamed protein product [Rotaria sp. Silwood1]CAF3714992.1 unnamed protein product [Rotaria sp. Silwood1]CAF4840052.1 unnamed protein product [Rotaria sp. Silwood1]